MGQNGAKREFGGLQYADDISVGPAVTSRTMTMNMRNAEEGAWTSQAAKSSF